MCVAVWQSGEGLVCDPDVSRFLCVRVCTCVLVWCFFGQPIVKPPTPRESTDSDAPLPPHRGRFYVGEESSDTDSSSVGSIVHKRDMRRKLQGHSSSEDEDTAARRELLRKERDAALADREK